MADIQQLSVKRNFRDIAYLAAHGPVQLHANRLYRMGKLYGLDAQEISLLESLRITDVIDLRSPSERAAQPDVEIPGAVNHHIDMSAGLFGLDNVIEVYRQASLDPGSVDAEAYLAEGYARLPLVCSSQAAQVVRIITGKEDSSVIIHCAGGKDRTGFLTAMLLSIAGVGRQLIIDDYMRSAKSPEQQRIILERYLKRFREEYGIEIPPETARPFLTVDSRSITSMLDQVEQQFGGFMQYLLSECGCSPDEVEKLRAWLVG